MKKVNDPKRRARRPHAVDVINAFNNIPDRTEEILKEVREANVRMREQELADRRNREQLKNNRILAAKTDKYLHAINLIIEHREAKDNPNYLRDGNDPTSFSIPYYFFNFEDHIKIRDLLEAFLFKLKNAGCFEDFDRSPTTPLGSNIVFHKVNLNKLIEYRKFLTSDDTQPKFGNNPRNYARPLLEETRENFGKVTLPDGKKDNFHSGRFAGIKILILDFDSYIDGGRLRSVIKDKNQKNGMNNKVNISKWKNELKSDHKHFFDFYQIERHMEDDKYKLTYKTS